MGQLEQFLSDIAPNGDWQPLIDYINQNYISKNKIKNKIRELEQIKRTALNGTSFDMMIYKIDILNLILKEN